MNNYRYYHGKSRARGQGLVEYAIILALVALVSIVILAFVGLAANRNFGLICSIMGCREDVNGSTVLALDRSTTHGVGNIVMPQCSYWRGHGMSFYVSIYTNIDPNHVTVDTERGERYNLGQLGSIGTAGLNGGSDDRFTIGTNGVQRYIMSIDWPGKDFSKCPAAAVVQSDTPKITVMAPVAQLCVGDDCTYP